MSMSAVKFFRVNIIIIIIIILFLSFRRVLNVIYSFLGNSPASEFRPGNYPKRNKLQIIIIIIIIIIIFVYCNWVVARWQ